MTLIVKRFHVQPELDILFVKLTVQIGDCIKKTVSAHYASGGWRFHTKSVLFCNILNGDLYIDSPITGLFYISLGVSQTFGEGTL